jgi:hypothetical protein
MQFLCRNGKAICSITAIARQMLVTDGNPLEGLVRLRNLFQFLDRVLLALNRTESLRIRSLLVLLRMATLLRGKSGKKRRFGG